MGDKKNGSKVAFWASENAYSRGAGKLQIYFNAKSETDKSVK